MQRHIYKLVLHVAPRISARPDFLCLYSFLVRGAYTRTVLTLQRGGTVHLTGSDVLWDNLSAGVGNYLLLVTGDLERFVRAVPYGHGPFDVHLDVIGGAVSPRLRRETRAKLTGQVVITYSTNEAHYISVVDDDNVGTLFPDVRIRIVDDRGKRLSLGQHGLIRVKTDTTIDGYFGAPELDRAAFIDGWYQTGDFGYQPSRRTLVVSGRVDDMLNVGGIKIAPGQIEAQLKEIEGVRDALVTSVDNHMDTSVMLVAVELQPAADRTRIVNLITPLVQQYVIHYQLIVLSAFPRTETGKIGREAVKELYRQQSLTL